MKPLSDPMPELQSAVLHVLDRSLGLRGRSARFTGATPLLGAVPELDSMAVVALVGALEERLGLQLDDEDLNAQTFATVGSLCAMLLCKRMQAPAPADARRPLPTAPP